ncbi:MAG TPA: serine hydrolase, partial [Aquella sp.]|nr:serine hydrolase [Aquella sp.]
MRKIVLYLLSFIVFNSAALATTTDENVNKTMHNFMYKYAIPGAAVLLYKDGKVNQYLFGVMNKKAHVPVRGTTIFELGSVTKTFSALLLAQNVSSGEMNLDDKLVDYLDNSDGYSDSLKKITLLELATYTSSLPFNIDNMPYNGVTNSRNQKVLNQFLHTWVAPYLPGTAERYSNPG